MYMYSTARKFLHKPYTRNWYLLRVMFCFTGLNCLHVAIQFQLYEIAAYYISRGMVCTLLGNGKYIVTMVDQMC